MTTSFPPGFRWGVATSAFQIEGATTADGRGPSIWDTFAAVPGAVAGGDTGEPAADHYHRWPRDVALLAALGVDSYRFSVSWPRIQPSGRGAVSAKGIGFYRQLVEALREQGIEPFLTLYHWDLPQALEDDGGWRSRDTASRFAEYAALVHEELGDVVDHWTTLNEPYPCAVAGYGEGRHAPGAREGHGALAAAHHLLLGHGLAVQAMRAQAPPQHQFGIVLNQSPAVPVTESAADAAAAARQDTLLRRQFTDPLFGGRYAPGLAAMFDGVSDFSFRHDGDLAVIGDPARLPGRELLLPDARRRRAAPRAGPGPPHGGRHRRRHDPRCRTSRARAWAGRSSPRGSRKPWWACTTATPALPPMYVTENGCVYPDVLDEHGMFADAQRVEFLREHIEAARTAAAAGVDLRGYFCWSLLDNFEWAHGYKHRFGLVHVDYTTQRRTPRASYHWYRDFVAAQRG